MKKKTLAGLSGQLSRTRMKAITAGRPKPPPADCTAGCSCPFGPVTQSGDICYCADGGNILCNY